MLEGVVEEGKEPARGRGPDVGVQQHDCSIMLFCFDWMEIIHINQFPGKAPILHLSSSLASLPPGRPWPAWPARQPFHRSGASL